MIKPCSLPLLAWFCLSGCAAPLVTAEPLESGPAQAASELPRGEQVLDNDEANGRPPLEAYTVLNAQAGWSLPRFERIRLLLEITNLLDRDYAVRGIYAYDFLTEQFDDFYTPAPGRRFRAGLRWQF